MKHLMRPLGSHPVPYPASFDQYLAYCDTVPDQRWELIDGELVMMAGVTEAHAIVTANIGRTLDSAARRRNCRAYQNSILIRTPTPNDSAYIPDVVVRCGPVEPSSIAFADPVVVVEVQLPSTGAVDRGPKLDGYRLVPTLQNILLVYQDEVRVEHYRRAGDLWVYDRHVTRSDRIALPVLDATIDLSEVYEGLPELPGA
jgi:Uma2 family endonuclease